MIRLSLRDLPHIIPLLILLLQATEHILQATEHLLQATEHLLQATEGDHHLIKSDTKNSNSQFIP